MVFIRFAPAEKAELGENEMKISVQWNMLCTVYTGEEGTEGARGRKAKQDQQLELERCSNIYANFGAGISSVLSRGKYNDYKMKLFAATPRDIQ